MKEEEDGWEDPPTSVHFKHHQIRRSEMEHYTCTKCKEVKGEDQFYKDKYNKKTGHMHTCKTCDNTYQKAWREIQKAKVPVTA